MSNNTNKVYDMFWVWFEADISSPYPVIGRKKSNYSKSHVLLWKDFSDNLYLKLNNTQHISEGRVSVMEINNPLSIVSILTAHQNNLKRLFFNPKPMYHQEVLMNWSGVGPRQREFLKALQVSLSAASTENHSSPMMLTGFLPTCWLCHWPAT